jgi:Protein of unknown function (DUF2846)
MKSIHLFFLSVAVSGCSTVSPLCDIPIAEGDEATTIVVYRPSGVIGALYSTPMSIDNCRAKNLSNNSYIVYKLPPGEHRIAVEKRNIEFGSGANVTQKFNRGEMYYLKQNVNFVADLMLVTKEEALIDMPELKEIAKE